MQLFCGVVSRIAKTFMIAVLFAVAMLGGGELPILHAPQFAEAHAFVHSHMSDAAMGDAAMGDAAMGDAASGTHRHDATMQANVAGAGHHENTDDPPGSDHGCTHVHAHCCAATAILAAAEPAPPSNGLGQQRIERNAALPYGQLLRPPLRPPRLTA